MEEVLLGKVKNRMLEEIGSVFQGRITLYVEDNEVGGRRYWSDAISGGVVVWDTSLVSPEELAVCLGIEERLRTEDELEKRGCPDDPT